MEGLSRSAYEVSRHIDLKGRTRGEVEKMIFAAECARGNLLTIQCLADFGVFARVASRPNEDERSAIGRVVDGRISRGVTRGIRHEGDLAIGTNRKARAIFRTAEGTVHGDNESTTRKNVAAAVRLGDGLRRQDAEEENGLRDSSLLPPQGAQDRRALGTPAALGITTKSLRFDD